MVSSPANPDALLEAQMDRRPDIDDAAAKVVKQNTQSDYLRH